MKSRHVAILTIFLLSYGAFGQPPETIFLGTVIATGYHDEIPLDSDGPFPMGFDFTFFGNTYDQFYVSANGLIMFTDPDDLYNTEATIPTATTPNNYIAPFWDDLVIDVSGNILYKTIGVAPNRKCIIQFTNMCFYPIGTPLGTFTVILYETTNVIQVQYRLIVDPYSPKSHGESATIGIENSDGTNGVMYAFHNGDAIHTGQAISFTPSGGTCIINLEALYDGVYLTTNVTLPDPGIVNLVSPASDAQIGTMWTFRWSAATYASSYILVIDTLSTPTNATCYQPGLNLTYDITNLILNKTYYWAVFSSNATGTTWCEIQRFTTYYKPAPFPWTFWVVQGQDKTIKLNYTGGDTSPKTAIITSLPAQGQLYQYNAGARGSQITSVPTTVTDASMNVIYAATGSTGNSAGNFNFKINDEGGDSPERTITINVVPCCPIPPNVLWIGKSETGVEINFDLPMADPTGKQNQFSVKVNGSPVTINSASLKVCDPYKIVLTLATPLTGTETVLVSYTQGNVIGADGSVLLSFPDQTVILNAQTINFPPIPPLKYGDPPFCISATSSCGLPVVFYSSNRDVALIKGYCIQVVGLGITEITAIQVGDANCCPARCIRTLTVSKGDQTITCNSLPALHIGSSFDPGCTTNSGLPVSYTSSNPAVAIVEGNVIFIVGSGTTVITVSQAGNALWNPAPDVPFILAVLKVDQTITFSALQTKTYGDADFSPGATASSGLALTYESDNPDVAMIVSNMIHITGVGNALITASQAGDACYNPAPDVILTLTVNKADLTFTADDISKDYGAAVPTLTYTISGFVSGETISVLDILPSIQTTAVKNSLPGTYPIILSGGSDNNYNYLYLPGILTVILIPHENITYLFTPNNDGINDYWELPDMDKWGKCDVRVFNRWGKLVFADDDYNNLWDGVSNGNPLPEGAYYFVIKTENTGLIKGTVNIVR